MSNLPSRLHDIVLDILEEVVRQSTYEEVKRATDFPEPCILDTFDHPRLRPDLWAKYRGKRLYDIYQVWHTEGYGDAVHEVLRGAISPYVASINIVIVSGGEYSWTLRGANQEVR